VKTGVAKDLDLAERQIGAVLKALEAKHPSYCVTDLGVTSYESTNLDSTRTEFQRRVVITLMPNATNEWTT
jgi:hypothetical protein